MTSVVTVCVRNVIGQSIRFCFQVFVYKQKTAYEMRISDWSSDVCSSDLKGSCAMLHEQPDRAPSRAPGRANAAVPLFVDVDGTLTRADISLESFVRIGRSSIAALIAVLAWLVEGRAVAKTMAARSEEHKTEHQSLMRSPYDVHCLE